MAEVQRAPGPMTMSSTISRSTPASHTAIQIPKMAHNVTPSMTAPPVLPPSQPRTTILNLENLSPVNQNGSYEFDRVLKSGYVEKRGRKTRAWKRIYLVLRPNELSIYKDANEEKLRHKITLSELTAVAYLKDKKQKRDYIFGLFSPARNWHLEAPTLKDAHEWVELIRQQARIEDEEIDQMFLASPGGHLNGNYIGFERHMTTAQQPVNHTKLHADRISQSSPEPTDPAMKLASMRRLSASRRISHIDYSGNEMASHSDMSDIEPSHHLPFSASTVSIPIPEDKEASSFTLQPLISSTRPPLPVKNPSQGSAVQEPIAIDPERVVYQGHLLHLRSHNGIKAWKETWLVLRPKTIALYKDDSEYSPRLIIDFSTVIDVVEIDAISRTKRFCMQVITEEKSYRFCAHDERELDKVLGAFKSVIAKREGRVAGCNVGI